jgi:hypothetical protein
MKMLGYNATYDYANRWNSDVHYRLYWSKRSQSLVVICVQDFDYPDYDDNCFIDYVAYDTQVDADRALALTLAVIAAVNLVAPLA